MSSEVLPADEAHQLTKCERIIGDGFTTFLKVGLALGEVRDSRLYRAEFESFEDYCDKKWSLTRTRAYQIMSAALTANEVSKKLDTDLNEAQARAIKPVLDEHGADAAAAVISDAHESGKVTAGAINQAAADRGLVAPRPAKVTTTTRTTEATKIEHDVDLATGEIASPGSAPAVTGEVPSLADSGPAPDVEPEQESGALDLTQQRDTGAVYDLLREIAITVVKQGEHASGDANFSYDGIEVEVDDSACHIWVCGESKSRQVWVCLPHRIDRSGLAKALESRGVIA